LSRALKGGYFGNFLKQWPAFKASSSGHSMTFPSPSGLTMTA
jgi:hypothetical protein